MVFVAVHESDRPNADLRPTVPNVSFSAQSGVRRPARYTARRDTRCRRTPGLETERSERYPKRAAPTGRPRGRRGLRSIDIVAIRESRAADAGKRMLEQSIALANVIPPGAAAVLLDSRGDNLDSATSAARLDRMTALKSTADLSRTSR